jgi:TRAP transporter TAXI family solute receptor
MKLPGVRAMTSVPGIPPVGRRLVQAGFAVAAVTALALWWLLPSGTPSYPHRAVSFATGSPSGVYGTYGKLLKQELGRDLPGVTVTLVNTEGSVDNVKRTATGRADFTIAAADAVADYDGPGRSRLRACARLYDDYIHLVVPARSPVRSAADLRHERVGVGQPNSGIHLIAMRLLRAAGLDPGKDVTTKPVGIGEAPDLLRKGELDAFFWSGGLPTHRIEGLADHFPIRLVPLANLARRLHAQGGKARFYRQAVMPADAYPDVQRGEAVQTIAIPNLLVTPSSTDPGLVERVTRAVIDSRDRVGKQVHAAQLVDLRTAVFTNPLPLHEGARRYYRSVKP